MKTRTGFVKKDVFVVLGCIVFMLMSLGAIVNCFSEEAKRLKRRSVCLSNLKMLTLAWIIYYDDNDDKIVNGAAGISRPNEPAWVGRDWDPNYMHGKRLSKKKQIAVIKAGLLWPYHKDEKLYKCPQGQKGYNRTYSIIDCMNGVPQPDNPHGRGPKEVMKKLIIKQKSQIRISHQKIVFIDEGWATPGSYGVYYDKEKWWNPPPVRHEDGTTVSFADCHAEYWKWKGEETIKLGKMTGPTQLHQHVEPKTVDGKYDLHKLQWIVWKMGYYKPSVFDE
ncbi:MAG: hypothetical protein GWN67_23245 [Phycisphaerae bacterium]|nr:hypothetical protein [Phycisphaerae bacterium]NIP53210.1 hypothetical protein [Phycisphaerae bacterium]NIS52245.1 hypothetical protein [Phycisphaerae bacterium]NIU09771.1 hypothetical protein [Phycisphaerae bacterium]NIU59191.1 hypothetical protein [Phycisphaerae bacterium]